MDHEKKLSFIAKMTKMGLDHIAHLDSGGRILEPGRAPISPVANSPATTLPAAGPSVNPGGTTDAGGLNSLFGLSNNYRAVAPNLTPGTNPAQLNAAYTGVQGGLNQTQGIVNQVTPGVAQGIETQGALSGQLANEAAGVGPNPAQSALNENAGRTTAATAAAIAGARGSNNNVGLLTRQAANVGAQTAEQANGEAATLGAQQQIAAQQQEAQLAGTQINQGAGAIQTLNQEQQNEQNILQGANTAANNAAVSAESNINSVNAQIATGNQNASQNTAGGILGGIASALPILGLFAKGGMVRMDKGGKVLDANARKHIAPENFALPGGRYPIHDIAHGRNALARVSQNGTPEEKAKVKAAVHKKYPELSGKKMAKGGEVACGSETTMPGYSKGGSVRDGYLKMASGGALNLNPLVVAPSSGPQSFAGQWLNSSVNSGSGPVNSPVSAAPPAMNNLKGSVGDAVGAIGSALKPAYSKEQDENESASEAAAAAAGSLAGPLGGVGAIAIPGAGSDFARGGKLAAKGGNVKAGAPSEKASVQGDSLKNDKIPAMLSEGEVVIDRKTLSDPGPLGQMARAVASQIEKRNKTK